MANYQYLCGYSDPVTHDRVDFMSTVNGLESFRGDRSVPVGDFMTSMKGKQDYLGNFWFIGIDTGQPARTYMMRAARDPNTGAISVAYKILPFWNETIVPKPNQVTADKDGNVYFPLGNAGGLPMANKFVVGKVTSTGAGGSPAIDPSSDWVITLHEIAAGSRAVSPIYISGISLTKDHVYGAVYVTDSSFQTNRDGFAFFDTATMTFVDIARPNKNLTLVQNIETDVSGGPSDGRMFAILMDLSTPPAVNGIAIASPAFGAWTCVLNAVADEDTLESFLAIDLNGEVITVKRKTIVPAGPNLQYRYAQSGGAGILDPGVAEDMTWIIPLGIGAGSNPAPPPPGNTTIMNEPRHVDIRRSVVTQDRWQASGSDTVPIAEGDVREIDTAITQTCREILRDYLYMSTATAREAHT